MKIYSPTKLFFVPKYVLLYESGNEKIFTDDEIIALRTILMNNGFLHADDNYGMDKSFRKEMKRVFPNKNFVNLPNNHRVFDSYYNFPNGLPKVHEHDNKPPQAFGIFKKETLVVLYTYETDLGDGWEDEAVHNNSWELREKSLKKPFVKQDFHQNSNR